MNIPQASTKVVTYQSPLGASINITPSQVQQLTAQKKWPKDHTGVEFCSVSKGKHSGHQSIRDLQEVEELLKAK